MNIAIIIPARFDSSRFPGKPLVKILGIPMIERVWKNASKAVGSDFVYVATDSKKIEKFCLSKNINVVMTSKNCKTGSDRVAEAAGKLNLDYVINIQGDEPLVDSKNIKKIFSYAKKNQPDALNCMTKIKDDSEFRNINIPKIIFDKNKFLIYISRASIPLNKKNNLIAAYKQISIYGFSKKIINFLMKNPNKSFFEEIEDIEIIRLLEYNKKIKMLELNSDSIAVDIKSDVKKVEFFLKDNNLS